ncbi:hypothetical protein [Arcanobacterium phocae]|uniref:hypothetical protein n=1 Tax=Arcanobacterium phocae TaxID=131112 RepID=UPI001C0F27A8|nr:hypothetical protein [Arcanobacterium phocae]
MENLATIGTLATPVMVIGIVTLLKDLGVKGKAATLSAVLVGVIAAFAQEYLDAGVLQTIVLGLQLGLGGAGIYDLTKTTKPAGKHAQGVPRE